VLRRVIVIGVTGSCGKTTTKELIAAVLTTQFPGRKTLGNQNTPPRLARAILRVKPWDRFCVLEIAAGHSFALEIPLRFVRPQIGVVTTIGTDHLSAFHTVEAIAREKGKLISALPPHGTAVLNLDDPNVRAMQARCAARVMTYGLTSDAMVRAENIDACWPQRLTFTVVYAGQSHAVHTQLCGSYWVPCVLAALAVGLAVGVPLAKAVQAVGTVRPLRRRMNPVVRQDGVTVISDDMKTPVGSIAPALQFMREARVKRKIIVIGSLSDYSGNSDRTYVGVARQALEVADRVVFVGQRASKCLKAKRHPHGDALQAFHSVHVASDHLRDWWQPGDLVLLKGSARDHLGAVVRDRRPANGTGGSTTLRFEGTSTRPAHVVVGLGNPGEQYQHTPHNVGHRVVDALARSFGAEWIREGQTMLARVEAGQIVHLVKPLTLVNAAGPALLQLSHRLGFGSDACMLVHDDLDLPLGAVRVRMRGSDGGHRGVRSILDAFRTDAIRRVRIGVGRLEPREHVREYVLTPFSPPELAIVSGACAEAADRVLKLLEVADSSEGGRRRGA
jgi:aminoacyl-tRNA hydrolase